MSIGLELDGVVVAWQRLEDYCNFTDRGTPFLYTAGIMTADDLTMYLELGERAGNMWMEKIVDGWDPLLDVLYAQAESEEMW